VALANSSIILGMSSCVAVWPYILAGAIIPLFVMPWLSGQVLGGYLGAFALVKAKVTLVRFILIGIMTFTSFSLVSDGLAKLNLIPRVSGNVSLLVFFLVMALVVFLLLRAQKRAKEAVEIGQKDSRNN